jgi:hypothetical protein
VSFAAALAVAQGLAGIKRQFDGLSACAASPTGAGTGACGLPGSLGSRAAGAATDASGSPALSRSCSWPAAGAWLSVAGFAAKAVLSLAASRTGSRTGAEPEQVEDRTHAGVRHS